MNEELKDENEFRNIFERISLIKKEINIHNMFEKGIYNIFKKIRQINETNKKFSKVANNIFITQRLLNGN